MSEISFPYVSNATTVDGVTTYDRTATASDLRSMISALISNGVYATPATNLQVSKGSSAMQVTVAAGKAWINGAYYELTAAKSFTIPTANGSNPRIDTIVLRDSASNRKITCEYVTGTAAASPSAKSPTRTSDTYELVLAQIRVEKGAVSITNSKITDRRANTSVCGYVTGVVKSIDTTNLFQQYDAAFNEWFDELNIVLSGDVAGNLYQLCSTNATNIDNVQSQMISLHNSLQDELVELENHTYLRHNNEDTISVYKFANDLVPTNSQPQLEFSRTKSTNWSTDNYEMYDIGYMLIKKTGWYIFNFNIFVSDCSYMTEPFHVYITEISSGTKYLAAGLFKPWTRALVKGECYGNVTAIYKATKGDHICCGITPPKTNESYRINYKSTQFTVKPLF